MINSLPNSSSWSNKEKHLERKNIKQFQLYLPSFSTNTVGAAINSFKISIFSWHLIIKNVCSSLSVFLSVYFSVFQLNFSKKVLKFQHFCKTCLTMNHWIFMRRFRGRINTIYQVGEFVNWQDGDRMIWKWWCFVRLLFYHLAMARLFVTGCLLIVRRTEICSQDDNSQWKLNFSASHQCNILTVNSVAIFTIVVISPLFNIYPLFCPPRSLSCFYPLNKKVEIPLKLITSSKSASSSQ